MPLLPQLGTMRGWYLRRALPDRGEGLLPWMRRVGNPVAHPIVGAGLFTSAYVLAVFLGRMAIAPGANFSLVWPAAGVSVTYLVLCWQNASSRPTRAFPVAVALLYVATYLGNLFSGAPLPLALAYGAANVVFALVAALVFLHPWQALTVALDSRRKLTQLAIGCLAGAMASLPFGPVVAIALNAAPMASLWQWVLRTASGGFVVCAVLLLLMQGYGAHLSAHSDTRRRWRSVPLILATIASYLLVFVAPTSAPLVFLVIPVSIWAAASLSVNGVVLHTTLVSVATVIFTLYQMGPFHDASAAVGASLAQTFLLVLGLLTFSLVIDRNERARLLAQVEASRMASEFQAKLLDTIVATMSEGVTVVQWDGAVVWSNESAQRLLQGDLEHDSPGSKLEELNRALHDPSGDTDPPVNRALRGEPVPPTDVVLARGNQPEQVLSVQAHPMSYEGQLALAIFRDVTDTRWHTAELTSFAGVVAHDLLNPIGSIQGWAEVLGEELEANAPGIGAEPLRHVSSAARRMHTIVTDLLSYSVTREGQLSLAPVKVAPLVNDLVGARIESGRISGLVPRFTVDADTVVLADAALVRQLLDNLIGNAVKYAPAEQPADVEITALSERDGWVTVRVEDRGVGLPAGQEELIFREFHRVAEHRKAYPGTGLGLSICRRIVERHGGRITASARSGGGSRFEFVLPAAAGGAGVVERSKVDSLSTGSAQSAA